MQDKKSYALKYITLLNFICATGLIWGVIIGGIFNEIKMTFILKIVYYLFISIFLIYYEYYGYVIVNIIIIILAIIKTVKNNFNIDSLLKNLSWSIVNVIIAYIGYSIMYDFIASQ